MKLTDGEKLIALMLADLHEHLEIDSDIDATFIKNSIYNENLWSIPFRYSGIQFENSELPAEVKEVLNIMDMWRFIEYNYSQLNPEHKDQLVEAAKPFGNNPRFNGFDGNNETEYLGIAQCIVDEHNLFEEFKDRDLNSHAPAIDSYRRMLSAYNPIKQSSVFEFNGEECVAVLAQILQEKMHPSNR